MTILCALAAIYGASLAALFWMASRAEEGWQDERGFHRGRLHEIGGTIHPATRPADNPNTAGLDLFFDRECDGGSDSTNRNRAVAGQSVSPFHSSTDSRGGQRNHAR